MNYVHQFGLFLDPPPIVHFKSFISADDLELVAEECLPEYDNLQLLQSEPIQADKILSVKSANGAFKYEARNLQVS